MGISTYFEDMGTVLSSFFFKSSGLVLVEVVLSANIHYPGTTEDTWDRRGHSFVYIMKENIFQKVSIHYVQLKLKILIKIMNQKYQIWF